MREATAAKLSPLVVALESDREDRFLAANPKVSIASVPVTKSLQYVLTQVYDTDVLFITIIFTDEKHL